VGEIWRVRTQVMAIGPLGLEYLDPANDPRASASAQAGQQQATPGGKHEQGVKHQTNPSRTTNGILLARHI